MVTRRVMASGRSEIMKKIQVKTLLKLHEIVTIPAILINSETWILNKTEKQKIDRMEIWALKKLLGLPKTMPTAGLMFECGTLFMSVRVDEKQLLYLHKLLTRRNTEWTKKLLLHMEHENIGWAKHIKQTLEEYGLEKSWEELGKKTYEVWESEVKESIERRNMKKIIEYCYNKNDERTKTKFALQEIQSGSHKRGRNHEIFKRSKSEVRALLMGRYGMLECAGNYRIKYKGVNCLLCHVLDNEMHRMNYCPKWRGRNLCNSDKEVVYNAIYSNDPEILSIIAMSILALWDLENGKNEMRV
jgi:hypothetical protein